MRGLVLSILISLLAFNCKAQELSSLDIESKIYYYGSIGKEDSMKYYYNYAIKHKILINAISKFVGDYYFGKKMYATALKHYETAFESNSYDINLHYKMYVGYSYLNLTDKQNVLMKRFTKAQEEYYGVKKRKLLNLEFYSGTFQSNNFTKNANINLMGKDNILGKIDRGGSLYYLYVASQYKISNKWNASAALNFNSIDGNSQFQHEKRFSEFDKLKDTTFKNVINKYKVSQYAFYGKAEYLISFDLKAKIAYNLLSTNYALNEIKRSDDDLTYQYPLKHTHNRESLFGLMLNYRKPRIGIDARFYYMPFSKKITEAYNADSNRTQYDVSVSYYPFQQFKGYARLQASLLSTERTNAHFVFTYDVTAKINARLWLNVTYQNAMFDKVHNNLKNFIDGEGTIIYNIDDEIKNRLAAKFLYYYGKHLEFSMQAGVMNRQGRYETYDKRKNTFINHKISYTNNILSVGTKWTF